MLPIHLRHSPWGGLSIANIQCDAPPFFLPTPVLIHWCRHMNCGQDYVWNRSCFKADQAQHLRVCWLLTLEAWTELWQLAGCGLEGHGNQIISLNTPALAYWWAMEARRSGGRGTQPWFCHYWVGGSLRGETILPDESASWDTSRAFGVDENKKAFFPVYWKGSAGTLFDKWSQ